MADWSVSVLFRTLRDVGLRKMRATGFGLNSRM